MTDKEFKRLSRAQLVDIIYQLQLKLEELTDANEKLSKALDDRRLRITKAGNIAEAALEIHNVLQAAQDAAEHYLEEMRLNADGEYQRIVKEANEEAAEIIENAKKEAARIMEQAKTQNPAYDSALEVILREYGSSQ